MNRYQTHWLIVLACSSFLGAGCSKSEHDATKEIAVENAGDKSKSGNRVNYRFNIDEWLPRFSLDPSVERYSGDIITGPCHICNNELLRKGMQDQYVWGRAVPIDIFVMAEGEPPHRDVTKIGGLPYRSANIPWPTNKKGEPLLFLGQFNFADSKDITGDLPGDLLLVFADSQDGFSESVVFEWQLFGLENLVSAEAIPVHADAFEPCYGHVLRTVTFPEAEDVVRAKIEKYPRCGGKDVWSDYLIPKYQATQIGSAPFFIQGNPELPGRLLCTLSSVQPDQHERFPWINHADPLMPEEKWDFDQKHLMFGDMGSIYISIDEQQQLHWSEQCY
jgi:hypothetical protein